MSLVFRFFADDPNEIDFSIPIGGDHFDAFGDLTEAYDDLDLSETGSTLGMDPDDEDDYMAAVWGGLTATAAGGLIAAGVRASMPFLIGGTDTGVADAATDAADAAASGAIRDAGWVPTFDNGGGAATGAQSGQPLPPQQPPPPTQ